MKISEILTDASRWTKNALERDQAGQVILFCYKFVPSHRYCLMGAVKLAKVDCGFFGWWEATMRVPLCVWNDAPERTFQEVREVVDRFEASVRVRME